MFEKLIAIFANTADWILGIIVGTIILVIILKSLKFQRLNFNERIAVDRAGVLKIKKSLILGYAIVITALQYERILRVLNVGTEYSIPLYKDKEVWIDLRQGGRATLIAPRVWIKITDPKKAMIAAYEGGKFNFEELIGSIAATTISGHLRTLNVEETMEMTKSQDGKKSTIWEILKEQSFFKDLEESRGILFCGFTFKDVDFSEEVTKKRREEFDSRLGIQIAKNKAEAEVKQRAGSAPGSVEEILRANPGISRREATEMWFDLQQRSTGTKITNEFDFGGSKNPLAEAAAVHGTTLNKVPQKKKGTEEEDSPSFEKRRRV